jgi:hypothetical protein
MRGTVIFCDDDLALPLQNLGFVASLLAAILYHGNLKRRHKLWNIVSTQRDILHMHEQLEYCFIKTCKWKVHNGKIENYLCSSTGIIFFNIIIIRNKYRIYNVLMSVSWDKKRRYII